MGELEERLLDTVALRTVSWVSLREAMRAGMDERRRVRFDRAVRKARARYRKDIRQYRGVDRLRRQYRLKKQGW